MSKNKLFTNVKVGDYLYIISLTLGFSTTKQKVKKVIKKGQGRGKPSKTFILLEKGLDSFCVEPSYHVVELGNSYVFSSYKEYVSVFNYIKDREVDEEKERSNRRLDLYQKTEPVEEVLND